MWAKSHDSVHKPQFLERTESRSGSNRGPSAYQSSTLPLGHTGSRVLSVLAVFFSVSSNSAGACKTDKDVNALLLTETVRGDNCLLSQSPLIDFYAAGFSHFSTMRKWVFRKDVSSFWMVINCGWVWHFYPTILGGLTEIRLISVFQECQADQKTVKLTAS